MKFKLRVIVIIGAKGPVGEIQLETIVYDKLISANCLPKIGEDIILPVTGKDTPLYFRVPYIGEKVQRVGHELEGRTLNSIVIITQTVKFERGLSEGHASATSFYYGLGFEEVHCDLGVDLPQFKGFK